MSVFHVGTASLSCHVVTSAHNNHRLEFQLLNCVQQPKQQAAPHSLSPLMHERHLSWCLNGTETCWAIHSCLRLLPAARSIAFITAHRVTSSPPVLTGSYLPSLAPVLTQVPQPKPRPPARGPPRRLFLLMEMPRAACQTPRVSRSRSLARTLSRKYLSPGRSSRTS